jgi:hypothetical protein
LRRALARRDLGTPGIFQGTIYQPDNVSLPNGWILVQGRHGVLHKVEVSRARVVFADSIPAFRRRADPAASLVHGAEVQVTAEQDGKGEWRATRIEIMHTAHENRNSGKPGPNLPGPNSL